MQNVLGSYSDYVRKMDTHEQMYGVAEVAPATLKAPPKTSRGVQLPTPNHKKEKLRKKLKVEGGKVDQSIPEDVVVPARKKKASVRPYQPVSATRNNTSMQHSVKHSLSPSKLPVGPTPTYTHSSSMHPTSTFAASIQPVSSHLTSVPQSIVEHGGVVSAHGSTRPVKKKVKKQKKRRNSEMESAEDVQKPCTESAPIPIKPRPEALNIPETAVQSDAPDTGDVRCMLQELLHPPPVSLVTPIPTPNTVKPFVFPAHSSVS
jgi:hypothetical protein